MELILSQIGTASFFKIVTKQEWIEGCPKQGSAHFCNQITQLKNVCSAPAVANLEMGINRKQQKKKYFPSYPQVNFCLQRMNLENALSEILIILRKKVKLLLSSAEPEYLNTMWKTNSLVL